METVCEGLTTRSLAAPGRHKELKRMNGAYQHRQLGGENEALKHPQRERILDFILSNQSPRPMRLLSFPGIKWPFEKMLLDQQDAWITGLEWTWGVIERGRPHVPDSPVNHVQFSLRNGTLTGVAGRRTQWLWCHAASFMGLTHQDMLGQRGLKRRCRRHNAVWLDFQAPVTSREVQGSLKNLWMSCQKGGDIPVAITVLAARDKSVSNRQKAICSLLTTDPKASFTIKESWKYQSGDSPMLNVTGFLASE